MVDEHCIRDEEDYNSAGFRYSAGVCQPETPAIQRKPALLRILTLLVVPTCAKRFYRHYRGQQGLFNRHYKGHARDEEDYKVRVLSDGNTGTLADTCTTPHSDTTRSSHLSQAL